MHFVPDSTGQATHAAARSAETWATAVAPQWHCSRAVGGDSTALHNRPGQPDLLGNGHNSPSSPIITLQRVFHF
jgi:hypothetical protein